MLQQREITELFYADGSEYTGQYGVSPKTIADIHARHIEIYAQAGADLVCFETVPSAYEAETICRVMEQFPHLPFWVSFSVCDNEHISDKTLISDAVSIVSDASNIIAAGFNCLPLDYVSALLNNLENINSCGYIVYPNIGLQWNKNNRAWEAKQNEIELHKSITEWLELGTKIIGGCCGSVPLNISEMHHILKRN